MEKEFINKNTLTYLNNDLSTKFQLQSKSTQEKKECLQILLNNMRNVYNKLDKSKITKNNISKVQQSFNKYALDKSIQEIQKKFVPQQSSNKYTSQLKRDAEIIGERNINYLDRPDFNSYHTENRTSSFDSSLRNEHFTQSLNRNIQYNEEDMRSGINARLDNSEAPEKQYEKLLQSRNIDVPNRRERPTTPDFSLDGSGAKAKKNNLSNIENFDNSKVIQENQSSNSFLSRESERINVASNRMEGDTYHLVGSNLDSSFGNVEFGNNELSNNLPEIDESINVSDRLKQLQSERTAFDSNISNNQDEPKQQTYENQRNMQTNPEYEKKLMEQQRQAYEQAQKQMEINEQRERRYNPPKMSESFTSDSQQTLSQNIPNQQLYDMINTMYNNIPKKEEKPKLVEEIKKPVPVKAPNYSNVSNDELNSFLAEINKNQANQLKQIQSLQEQMQHQLQNQQYNSTSNYQPDDDRVKNELISKVKILTGELEQYKKVNSELKKRLDEELKNKNIENEKKIKLIDKKKEEIKEEVLRLGNKHKEIEESYKKLVSRERTIKSLIDENSKFLSINRHNFIVDSSNFDMSGKYEYNFNQTLKNVTRIELNSYDFPLINNNINETNNKIYFKMDVIKSEETNNESDSEVKGSEEYEEVTQIIIPHGSYDISSLIKKMNKLCKSYRISFTYNKNSSKVTVKSESDSNLILYNDSNDSVLKMLGFIEDNYIDEKLYISDNVYDVRKNKFIKLVLNNISNAKFCEIGLNQNKTSLYYKDYDPPIKELSSLSISLLDTNGTIIDFCNLGHKLEFIITNNIGDVSLKSFNINSEMIDNEIDQEEEDSIRNLDSDNVENVDIFVNQNDIESDDAEVLISNLRNQLNMVSM